MKLHPLYCDKVMSGEEPHQILSRMIHHPPISKILDFCSELTQLPDQADLITLVAAKFLNVNTARNFKAMETGQYSREIMQINLVHNFSF
jgi:hypothetical protein